VEGAVRRDFVAPKRVELATVVGERLVPRPRPIEERCLRAGGAAKPPRRLYRGLGKELFPSAPRRQGRAHLRAKPLEVVSILIANHGAPRGQPVAQGIPAGREPSRGGSRTGAPQRVAAVGGNLLGGGHWIGSGPV